MDPVVDLGLALHARAHAGVDEEVGRPLLEQPGADAALDVVAAAVLEDHGRDAFEVQEMRQHQPGRPGPDDTDLRAHGALLSSARGDVSYSHVAGETETDVGFPCPCPGMRDGVSVHPSAAARSAMRSSGSSMPTESRPRVSPMPRLARTSGGTEPWVISMGCSIRLSTPPRLSASANSRQRSRKR